MHARTLLALLSDGAVHPGVAAAAAADPEGFVAGWLGLTPDQVSALHPAHPPTTPEEVPMVRSRDLTRQMRDSRPGGARNVERRMAATIVAEGDRSGICDEAAMRRHGFSARDIARHGEAAVARAVARRPHLADALG